MKVSFVKLLRYKKRNENISLDEKRIEGIISYTVIEDERGLFFIWKQFSCILNR